MSKYIKLEDLMEIIKIQTYDTAGRTIFLNSINSLPTIEVSEDAISRKWITSRIRSEYLKWLEDYDIDQILGDIEDAPSVISKAKEGEWIPCSERLPEDSGDYLVCPSDSVLEDYSDFSEVMIMPYDADCEAFGWWVERYDPISLGYVDSDFNEFEVLAWMPLPEPWKGAINEDRR